jgi:hypothetical protein
MRPNLASTVRSADSYFLSNLTVSFFHHSSNN